jgi:hypothetical protein
VSATGFTKKRIDLTITLGTGSFGSTVSDTVTLKGLRCTADIVCAGGDFKGALQLRVWGMPQERMNQLTMIGMIQTALKDKNFIQVAAGDADSMSVAYEGSITEAWADYDSAPDVAFNILAIAGHVYALKPVDARSYNSSSADVSGIMLDISKSMNLKFQDLGVAEKLAYPYFPGTYYAQAQKCAVAAHINFTIDRGTLTIWPNTAPKFPAAPIISPQTGLVGYPSGSSKYMNFKTIFNPLLSIPGQIDMQSSLVPMNGVWTVVLLNHSISSEMPGGPWFSMAQCSPNGR